MEGESRRDSEGGQNKLFLFAHILSTQRGKAHRQQKAPNNLAIIPALHGDGSIPLPFVFCHLAMSIMENPPFSPDSHGSEGGRSFSRRIISLNKCTKGRTMWGIWAVCVGDRIPSRSKQTRWRFFGFCLQFSQNCRQLCSGAHSVRPRLAFFYGPAGNFSQPTHIELQIYARWRAAGRRRLCAAYQKNAGSPLLPPYPGITEKPGEVESREKDPRCMLLGTSCRSAAITKETARSCRLHRGRNGLDTTMLGGPLTSSAVHHIIKIPALPSLWPKILSYAVP